MKKSKVYWSIFISICLVLDVGKIISCGGFFEPDYELYRFFDSELAAKPQFRPLYFSFERWATSWPTETDQLRNENLQDWQTYFKNSSSKDLEAAFYSTTLEDWKNIQQAIKNPRVSLTEVLKKNAVIQQLVQRKEVLATDYWILAKECEEISLMANDPWDDTGNDKPYDRMKKLSAEAEQRAKASTNLFWKTRYAYQAIRMAHYSYDYNRAITLYDQLLEPLATQSIVKYWALGHKAGALQKTGKDKALAAYLFAQVFAKSYNKRISAYLSFSIDSDQQWERALNYCKNNQEKTNLYFIRAIDPQNFIVEEMKNIYQLDPQSPYLDVLLTREIAKLETTLIYEQVSGAAAKDYGDHQQKVKAAQQNLPVLKEFIMNYLKTAKNTSLWIMGLGYCDYLAGNPQEARKSFARLQGQPLSIEAQKQIKIFEIMLELSEIKTLDPQTEENLYQKVKASGSYGLKSVMVATFAHWYKKQGESAKQYLSYNDIYNLKSLLNIEITDLVMAFVQKKNITSYEKELIAKVDSKNPLETLMDVKGTILFAQDKLEEAEKYFSQITTKKPVPGSPTEEILKDCEDCFQDSKSFTKLSLIKQIKTLTAKAQSNNREAVEANMLLGHIYYNMIFGNSWKALAYIKSYEFPTSVYKKQMPEMLYKNTQKPLTYYQKAFEISSKAKDYEMAAKACFMMAKCEQQVYYQTQEYEEDVQKLAYNQAPIYNLRYKTNFLKLKNNYSQTRFYDQATQACSYFDAFVKL